MKHSAKLMGVVCLLWAGSASAAGLIAGTVQNSMARRIAGAECRAAGMSAVSDAAGNFGLLVAAGTHKVTCEIDGYRSGSTTVTVVDGGKAVVMVTLRNNPRGAIPLAEKPAEKSAEPAQPTAKLKPATASRRGRSNVDDLLGALDGNSGGGSKARMAAPRPSVAYAPAGASPIAGEMPYQPALDREGYDHIAETGFKAVLDAALSTFSIDVDTASYANTRRYLDSARRPPKDAVKIEELINYFTYDYPEPDDEHPFSVNSEVSVAPWNPDHKLVHIGLQGRKVDLAKLPSSNLVFLIDVSGSMNSANKLGLLKQSFGLLVDNLRPEDTVSIVVYAGAAGLVLPPTGSKHRGKILAAINGLGAGGSTAGGAGIKLAYKVAQDNFIKGGNNRVILATDGDFNVGTSSNGDLVRLIETKRESGVFLTVLGFGTGNYQDAKMEQLADKGNGNHAYIDSILEAKKVLVSEMGGTLFTIAKDVKIQVEFNPAKVKGYRLIGYENRRLANKDFNDDKKDAGELGSGHTVTALYEIVPASSKAEVPGVDKLKYQETKISDAAKSSPELMTVKLRYKQPDGDTSTLLSASVVDRDVALADTSNNFRFSAAVAAFGMLLRDSEHKGNARWKDVAALAKGAMGEDRAGYRFEFVKLVQKAELLN